MDLVIFILKYDSLIHSFDYISNIILLL